MAHNFDPIPLQMTEEELKNYPQFCNLLASLKDKLAPDGSSKKVKEKLEAAKVSLCQSRHNWLMSHVIYHEIYELLANYEVKGLEGTLTQDDKQIQLCLSKTLSYNEIGDYLHFHPGVNRKSTLFGLSQEDIDSHNPAKHLLSELQKTIVPLLEDRLQRKCDDIYTFCQPGHLTQNSQPVTSGQRRSLLDIVEERKNKLQSEKEALKKDRCSREQHFWTYYQKLLDCLSIIDSLVNDYKLQLQANTDDITVDWLKTRCDALCLKVKLTQLQILCDTYTSETVKALKKISGHLDEAIRESESQLTTISYSLQAYHTIGAEFKALVNQFTLLRNEIDNRKWALSTLRQNSSQPTESPDSEATKSHLSAPSMDSLSHQGARPQSLLRAQVASSRNDRDAKKVSFQPTETSTR